MIDNKEIITLVNDFFVDSDIFAVEINVSDKNNIEIYLDSDTFVTIDNCVALNRHIESNFDRDKEDYNLMISSAGVTSPFTVIRQYRKNIGKEVIATFNDEKIVKGILKNVSDQGFTLTKQTLSNVKKGQKAKVKAEEDIFLNFNDVKITKLFFDFK
ncbi:ribosome assembly cofactor RimP [Bacteroidales bacterium OttesenSCG-928-K03]|nr:ribosome assembly cofactor RimP [Odoribacter sp. OttesenSCG-928-L07]MDL2239436.1 ribosome assembly cofactor RimP [Bacteroidales bacterium OttesenSCG-928-L14]MDL2240557.1 ribosome assembly cofactor RimP [Bacteroidales bacterium OttesenSCG-928-K22]MDL2242661.1 ribosome assembly cofactor RimP [Bacteroidales bacterium OttesenSCG-928-K03]